MKKLVIICCLFLTLGYASNSEEEEIINQAEKPEINEIDYLSLSEFLNAPIEELY
jgi:hypothetical protein